MARNNKHRPESGKLTGKSGGVQSRALQRIMMISTHGYVAANPELGLLPQIDSQLKTLSKCELEKVGPWLREFKFTLERMLKKLEGSSTLWVSNCHLGTQGPIAKSWPPGGSVVYDDRIYLNCDGTTNWQEMPKDSLDEYMFHELLHLCNSNILDEDATDQLYNAHSIQRMINNGILRNIFYKEALKPCKSAP